ncbi:phage head-tail adapter protein [Burkholderia sp. THE68]|uniref:phage head-tail adapter protein n=1 Tax=Burkholderia sp. THE68 TaxID=758782 RepID=UPI001E31FEF7|nr:phage head-tail adapter protein [Burkholderia sp. THE68]
MKLSTGAQGVYFLYTKGDGTRSVTYNAANLAALIKQRQQQLKNACRARAPIRSVHR